MNNKLLQGMLMPKFFKLDYLNLELDKIDQISTIAKHRVESLENLSKTFEDQVKQYFDKEDATFGAINSKLRDYELTLNDLGTFSKDLQKKQQSLQLKIREQLEIRKSAFSSIEDKYDKLNEVVGAQEKELANNEQQRQDKLKQIDTKILFKIDLPDRSNILKELYDWILVCLFQEKMSVEEFLIHRGIKLPVINKTCLTKIMDYFRPQPPAAWQAFKIEVFQKNDGFEFRSKLKILGPNDIKDFSLMLTEQIVDNRKQIINQTAQLDAKYQVRLLLDIVSLLIISSKVNEGLSGNAIEVEEVKSSYKSRLEDKRDIESLLKINDTSVNQFELIQSFYTVQSLKVQTDQNEINNMILQNDHQLTAIDMQIANQTNQVQKISQKLDQTFKDEERDKLNVQVSQVALQNQRIQQQSVIQEEQKVEQPVEEQPQAEVQVKKQKKSDDGSSKVSKRKSKKDLEDEAEREKQMQERLKHLQDDSGQEDEDSIKLDDDPLMRNIQKTLFSQQLKQKAQQTSQIIKK